LVVLEATGGLERVVRRALQDVGIARGWVNGARDRARAASPTKRGCWPCYGAWGFRHVADGQRAS